MSQDDEAGIPKAFPFPLEFGRVGPEELENLRIGGLALHQPWSEWLSLTSPMWSFDAGPISYPLRAKHSVSTALRFKARKP